MFRSTGKFGKRAVSLLVTVSCALALGLPVFALPPTGDGSSTMLPLMAGLLGLSLLLIVVYVVLSGKKKKGRR